MDWRVQIIGEEFVLEELSKSLNISQLCVFQEGQNFFLRCDDFDMAKCAEEVFDQAKGLVPILSGASQLTLGQPLRLANVFKKNEDGTRQEFGFGGGAVTLPRIFAKASGNGTGVANLADSVSVWVKIAKEDGKVTEALSLIGSIELNWVILYKIYEIIRDDVGGKKKLLKKEWVIKNDANRFTQTAQPYRHAENSKKMGKSRPHDRPMMFKEATIFIRTILDNWLRSKEKVENNI